MCAHNIMKILKLIFDVASIDIVLLAIVVILVHIDKWKRGGE
jgi:hypothetical protein